MARNKLGHRRGSSKLLAHSAHSDPDRPAPVTTRHDPSEAIWWWTIAQRSSPCSECSEWMAAGTTEAYCHGLKRAVCEICADKMGLAPKPSKRFLRSRQDSDSLFAA